MKTFLPTRDDVILKIEAMRSAIETRADVAAWAMAIIDDDTVDVTDACVWKVLKSLGAADLVGMDNPYLFTDEDFANWKTELK